MKAAYNVRGRTQGESRFRRFVGTYAALELTSWVPNIAIPLLIVGRSGVGAAAVSIGLRWLPGVFAGAAIAVVVHRFGAHTTLTLSLLASGAVLLLVPREPSLLTLQGMVVCLSLLGAVASPTLQAARNAAVPVGKEVGGNALVQGIERAAKMVGPALIGVCLAKVGAVDLLRVAGAITVGCGVAMGTMTNAKVPDGGGARPRGEWRRSLLVAVEVCRTWIRDPVMLGVVTAGIGYMLTFGSLQVYLLALAGHLGDADRIWTLTLSAQGAGATAGAVLAGAVGRRRLSSGAVGKLFFWASLGEALVWSALLAVHRVWSLLGVASLAGVPESLAFVAYYSLIQQRLGAETRGPFYSLTMPAYNAAAALGAGGAGLLLTHRLASALLIVAVAATALTVLPFYQPLGRPPTPVGPGGQPPHG